MTWKELKDFCLSLDETQLQKKVIVWREDEVISPIQCDTLSEDHYMGEDDEGCYPASDSYRPISELKKVYDKGHPILFEQF